MGHTVYFNIETTGQPVLQTLQEELAAFLDFYEKAGPFHHVSQHPTVAEFDTALCFQWTIFSHSTM